MSHAQPEDQRGDEEPRRHASGTEPRDLVTAAAAPARWEPRGPCGPATTSRPRGRAIAGRSRQTSGAENTIRGSAASKRLPDGCGRPLTGHHARLRRPRPAVRLEDPGGAEPLGVAVQPVRDVEMPPAAASGPGVCSTWRCSRREPSAARVRFGDGRHPDCRIRRHDGSTSWKPRRHSRGQVMAKGEFAQKLGGLLRGIAEQRT
jgi:hypothetical protein